MINEENPIVDEFREWLNSKECTLGIEAADECLAKLAFLEMKHSTVTLAIAVKSVTDGMGHIHAEAVGPQLTTYQIDYKEDGTLHFTHFTETNPAGYSVPSVPSNLDWKLRAYR
jgi:hypothetical protein